MTWLRWRWRLWRAKHHAYIIWRDYELWKAPLDYERWQRAKAHIEQVRMERS